MANQEIMKLCFANPIYNALYGYQWNTSNAVSGTYIFLKCFTYSSVPNRRAGRNKRAGGKILKKH